jgi:hypothetical protein
MSYEEEDTCHIHRSWGAATRLAYMSCEEEDTCHMRRRIHVIFDLLRLVYMIGER